MSTTFEEKFPSLDGKRHYLFPGPKGVFLASDVEQHCLDKAKVRDLLQLHHKYVSAYSQNHHPSAELFREDFEKKMKEFGLQ